MKTVIHKIKYLFSPDEKAGLNEEYRQLHKQVESIETEFDSVKKTYKAKISEAQARCTSISAKVDAGFELRDLSVVVVYEFKEKKKHYYLPSHVDEKTGLPKDLMLPLATEEMEAADFQTELLEAEGKFERKEDIELFNRTDKDYGVLIVGRQNGKWFSAIRAVVGGREISERLDGEQPCCKQRKDAVNRAAKRFLEWLKEVLGKDAAKGFESAIEAVMEAHKEREE